MPDSGPVSPSDAAEELIHCHKIAPLDHFFRNESNNHQPIVAVRLVTEGEDITAIQYGDCFLVDILAGPQQR